MTIEEMAEKMLGEVSLKETLANNGIELSEDLLLRMEKSLREKLVELMKQIYQPKHLQVLEKLFNDPEFVEVQRIGAQSAQQALRLGMEVANEFAEEIEEEMFLESISNDEIRQEVFNLFPPLRGEKDFVN